MKKQFAVKRGKKIEKEQERQRKREELFMPRKKN